MPEQKAAPVEVTAVRGFRFEGRGVKRGETCEVPAHMAQALIQASKAKLGKHELEPDSETPSAAPTDLGLGHPPAAAAKPAKK